jgi:hypothetical protein
MTRSRQWYAYQERYGAQETADALQLLRVYLSRKMLRDKTTLHVEQLYETTPQGLWPTLHALIQDDLYRTLFRVYFNRNTRRWVKSQSRRKPSL